MHTVEYRKYISDNKYGWQIDNPVFVKVPFKAFGKDWQVGEEFNWVNQQFREQEYEKIKDLVFTLFNTGRLHHDSSREVEQKTGDRLSELSPDKLLSLVNQLNSLVKSRCNTDKEYQAKRVKQSKIADKQRGLLRAWINRNNWALDDLTNIRNSLLGE